ncbi:MAG: PLP-dependent aspartate aminotransferase family protein [bacterium]|nr:PLP-dependent aspartate aminotransferase family protein [bacterium]
MNYEIETRCIHGTDTNRERHSFGAVTVPIYQTATFSHPEIGKSTGFDYSRVSNPTRRELEKVVASLEGALDAVAFSSGMAAITLCLELFERGSHFVCTEDLYGGSFRIFQTIGESRGRSFTYVDTSNEKAVEEAIRPETKAIYIETPSNPTMQVTDLAAMKRLADKHKLLFIVDNTFLSPYYQNPIAFGADLVIHSGTKFLAGHNDTLAGFLCAAREDLAEKIRYLYMTTGACLSPFDSFLVLRGIKTLAVRMEAQQKNAMRIAQWLKEQKEVVNVYYVGLKEHPGYETSKKQTRGFGSMISFQVDCEETARRILNNVRLITYAESLGGVESLITYPMLQTHADVPAEIREKLGITAVFLRMSVGIENCDDLIADLRQAMHPYF